jgi:hypothetical protein
MEEARWFDQRVVRTAAAGVAGACVYVKMLICVKQGTPVSRAFAAELMLTTIQARASDKDIDMSIVQQHKMR